MRVTNERSTDRAAAEVAWASLTPSDDTLELLTSTRAHFAKLYPSSRLLDIHADAKSHGDWDTLLEHGYTTLGLPDELDGIGTFTDTVMLAEEIGRALLPAPLTNTLASIHTLTAAGITPPDSPGPLAIRVGTTSGDALDVVDAAHATHLVSVVENTADKSTEITVHEVADSRAHETSVDPSRPPARIRIGDTVAHSSVPEPIDSVLAPARTLLAAELLGVAAHAFTGALEHARAREQFGRPIGAFQAIKHQLADAHVAVERARSLTYGAGAEITAGGRPARLSLLAKAATAELAIRCAALRTQLLGAMGLTAESDNHLAIRRAHNLAGHLGSPSQLYVRAATDALTPAGSHD